jgi:cell division septation protein DedD
MTANPARADPEKLRAFEQRMTREGAAGFAAGPTPWESWDEAGSAGTWRVQQDTVRPAQRQRPQRPQTQRPRKPAGHRILTGIARLSVLALGVGIAGVYFTSTTEPQLTMSGIQPAPIPVSRLATNTPLLAVQESGQHSVVIDPNALPAPAAGQPEIAVVAATTETQENAADMQASAGNADTAAAASVPGVMMDNNPKTTAPPLVQQTGQTETTETLAALQQPATTPATGNTNTPATEASRATTAPARAGAWVVNLASYNRESTAQRMLEEFRDKGVTAELVKVTVNDRPMIRIRTTGYGSLREANDWASLLEERLGLDGAWVSKR